MASTSGGGRGDKAWPKSGGLLVLLGTQGSLGAQRNLNHLPHIAQAQGSLGERHLVARARLPGTQGLL